MRAATVDLPIMPGGVYEPDSGANVTLSTS
jgi:hypothetical protein